MATFSKEMFYEILTPDITCQHLLHPWTNNCIHANALLFFHTFYGSAKFLLPLWLLKLVYNCKTFDTNTFKKQFNVYIRSVLFFTLYACSLLGINCCVRSVTGNFFYYVMGIVCGTVAGINIYIEPKGTRIGKCLLFTNLVIENLIKYCEMKRIIRRTPMKETIIFAILTAILMYLFETTHGANKLQMLWFFAPESAKKNNNAEEIVATSYNYSFQVFAKYFGIGYAMEFFSNLVRNQKLLMTTKSNFFSNLFRVLFATSNVRFGLFFGGFVGIYEMLMCHFKNECQQRKNKKKFTSKYALIAGFFAGFTYYLKPNISFNVMAFTTTLQILAYKYWTNYCIVNDKVKQIAFVELWTAFMCGILMHQRILHEDICVSYVVKVLDFLTNNRLTDIHSNFVFQATKKLF